MERKHRLQFSTEEITYTEKLVHSINEWDFSQDHVLDRMAEKHISKNDIIVTLKWGEVIEINDKGRIVLRLMKGLRKGVVVVISIRERVLVTAWYNDPRDNHKTLNLSDYNWDVDVIEYLKGKKYEPFVAMPHSFVRPHAAV